MRKSFWAYTAVWALSVAVFAVVLFGLGGRGAELFQSPSWPLALFCLASMLVQLVVGYVALGGKRAAGSPAAQAKGLFLGMPTLMASGAFSVASVVCGLVFINVEALPVWVGVVVLAVLLAADVACCAGTLAAAGHAAELDEATVATTAAIADLRTRAEALAGCAGPQAAGPVRRVAEALRYADPVSNEATRACDEELACAFGEFERAVRPGGGGAGAPRTGAGAGRETVPGVSPGAVPSDAGAHAVASDAGREPSSGASPEPAPAASSDVERLANRVLSLVSERASLCKQGKRR